MIQESVLRGVFCLLIAVWCLPVRGGGKDSDVADRTLDGVLLITGASSLEELDESVLERFEHYRVHPLKINEVSVQALVASGLFSQYLAASLFDYRKRNGDVLSLMELTLVDGFGMEMVKALEPFISLQSKSLPGKRARDNPPPEIDLRLRTVAKKTFDGEGGATLTPGVKFSIGWNDRVEFNWASRLSFAPRASGASASGASVARASASESSASGTSASGIVNLEPQSDPRTAIGTFSLEYRGRGCLEKLMVGDFNMRMGQGVAVWSGFSMTGFGTVTAFDRSAGGVSMSGSYLEANRGAAAVLSFGRWSVSAALSLPGLRSLMEGKKGAKVEFVPMLGVQYVHRKFTLGATACRSLNANLLLSTDGRMGFRGGCVFWEVAMCAGPGLDGNGLAPGIAQSFRMPWHFSGAGVAGVEYSPRYGEKFAVQLRLFPSGYDASLSGAARALSSSWEEHGLTLGMHRDWLDVTGDMVHCSKPSAKSITNKRQYRMIVYAHPTFAVKEHNLSVAARVVERLTRQVMPSEGTSWKTDIRLDAGVERQGWSVRTRISSVVCKGASVLWNLELGKTFADDTRKMRSSVYVQGTLFRVDNWDDRVYVYQRDAPGNFGNIAYYGRGYDLSLYASGSLERHSLYLRVRYIAYPGTEKPSAVDCGLQYNFRF